MNQGAQFVRHLQNMIVLARVIAQGARNRDESRGAHFKPEFPQRDDANFMRTTLALHRGAENGTPDVGPLRARARLRPAAAPACTSTDAVDVSLVRPRARKYDTAGAASAVAASGPTERASSVSRPSGSGQPPRRPLRGEEPEGAPMARDKVGPPRGAAARRPGHAQLLAAVRGAVAAAHERHQRAHGDPEAPGHRRPARRPPPWSGSACASRRCAAPAR